MPQRREQSHRKAKGRSILTSLQKTTHSLNNDYNEDLEEPPEFNDSDSDPAWTPQVNIKKTVIFVYISWHK